tara:strand:+ start:234 stop:1835 length:1602 start_codon:yes stop_codon:yes gene_type:complete
MIKFKTLLISIFLTSSGFFLAQENRKDSIIIINNLGFNTKYSDFGSTIFKDSILYFASNYNTNRLIKRKWRPNMQPFLDLYSIDIKKKFPPSKVKLNNAINTKYHESSVAFNSDYTVMYFTRNGEREDYKNRKNKKDPVKLKLYSADLIDNDWKNIKELPFNSALYSIGHPALSNDQKKLYFISDMPGGYGESDIYRVDILANGSYSTPINLGPKVNTKGKEMFPFIDENNILYFSTNGFIDSYGGLDIYYYILDEKTHKPTNAGKKINSSADDFSFTKKRNQKQGYFSSNRPGGIGDDDIYSYEGDFVMYPKKCYQEVEIVIKDKDTKTIINNAIISLSNENKEDDIILKTNQKGIVKIKEKCNRASLNYTINSLGYINKMGKLLFSNKNITNTYYLAKDIKKDNRVKLVKDKLLIIIGDVLFDLNSDKIREDAAIKINNLVKIMKEYPEIKVEIGSHTDSRGNDKYNLKLSAKRFVSIRNYIVTNGISENRLTGKGFGETQILNKCLNGISCNDYQHQINRRVEFTIISHK